MYQLIPQIEELMKGCGKSMDFDDCGYEDEYGKVFCDCCKRIIQTWKSAINGEIEFLNKFKMTTQGFLASDGYIMEQIDKRLSELKSAREMLG